MCFDFCEYGNTYSFPNSVIKFTINEQDPSHDNFYYCTITVKNPETKQPKRKIMTLHAIKIITFVKALPLDVQYQIPCPNSFVRYKGRLSKHKGSEIFQNMMDNKYKIIR
jgi:hypothetical protein